MTQTLEQALQNDNEDGGGFDLIVMGVAFAALLGVSKLG